MSYASQEFLYQLICKLKPKQKRDFLKTLQSKSNTSDKTNYQILFEQLADLDTYDEDKLKRRLKKSMSDEVISVVKNKLTERLLEYLRSESEETALKKLHRWLDYMEVLFNKDMFSEVVIYCEKVKKEAWQNDLHTIILEANRWKGRCLPYTEREHYQADMAELRAESMRSHEMISLTYKIGDYYHQVMGKIQQHFNLRNQGFRDYMAQMMENPLFSLDASNKEYSFMPACYLAMTKHFLYKIHGDFEMAFQQESIAWNRISKEFAFHYKNKRAETIGAVINYLEALSKTKHTDLLIKHMAFIETLLANEEKGNYQLETGLRLNQLNHLVKSKGEKLSMRDILPFEQIYNSGLADQFVDFKRLYAFYLANAYFDIRDYQKAMDYMLNIQEKYSRTEVRSDQYEYARINHIVYAGCLVISRGVTNDDIPAFQNLIYSYSEHIRHKPAEDDYRFESALADFFRSLKQNMKHADVLQDIDVLEKKLDEIFSEQTGYVKLIRADFDYPVLIKRWREYLQ